MGYKEKIAAMTATRTIVGYAADSHEQTFTTTRTNAMADVTAPAQAEQIIKQGIATWALVLDGAGAIISEHGDVPSLRLLGLPVNTDFLVRGRRYTATGGNANAYAYNGTDGARYDVLAFAGNGRVVRMRFDARTPVSIVRADDDAPVSADRFRVLVSESGIVHAADSTRPDYFLCGSGSKFGSPNVRAGRSVRDFGDVDCKRCRAKLDA